MKKTFYLILISIAFSVNAMASYHEPYNGSRIFWDSSTRTTVFSSGGYGRLIQLQDGRLMACTESGGINVAYSTNGTMWSTPEKIVTNTNNTPECVPDLIQLQDGTIIVAYNPRPSAPYTEDRRFGIRCKRSTDNGKTWSDEIFVNDASYTFQDGCWEPSMLQLPSGEVQLYFADEGPYTSSGEQQISMCRSFDGGQTCGKAEIISFRKNFRDGMPVPVLLHDGKTIAVAIEDNGWSGFGSFIPTIVTCPLETNWHNFWVNANSPNRWQAINYSFCARALGGAPYLRVLPWGETVLSHQSDYGDGQNQMWIYIGNEEAKDFKAMSSPFPLGDNDNALWNSVAVIDTGVVVAFAGINGHDEIMKGYPVRLLQAPYAKPTIDGKQTRGEGYFKPLATQVILGTEKGTRFTADFAYDDDSLYISARASDRTQYPIRNTTYTDGISIYLDAKNLCESTISDDLYKIFMRLDSTVWFYKGVTNTHRFVKQDDNDIRLCVQRRSTYYIMEAAVPWSELGFEKAPVNQVMRLNVELSNRTSESSSTLTKEMLPDAKANSSWTWMEFRLQPNPDETGISSVWNDGTHLSVTGNRININSDLAVVNATLYTIDGKVVASRRNAGKDFSIEVPTKGITIVKLKLANEQIVSRKIVI